MTTVIGKMNVEVTISREEAFQALAKELGVMELLEEHRDSYYRLETKEDGTEFFAYYEDVCCHGTPYYSHKSKYDVTDQKKVKAYKLMKEIGKLIKEYNDDWAFADFLPRKDNK